MKDNKFVFVKGDDRASEVISSPTYSYWKSVAKRFFSSKVAVVMLVIMTVIIFISVFHPMISGYDHAYIPFVNDKTKHFLGPSASHVFGTDDVGRDVFDMVWAGTQTSLFVAFTTTIITTVLGVVVGMFWGFSKKVDSVMIEVYNVVNNVPFTLIVMVLAYSLDATIWSLIFSLSCTTWIGVAYMIRVQVMIIRDREYNMASQCLGTPTTKIIFNNILPFLISVIMTSFSRSVPTMISYEVFLGYLGVGLSQEYASLGRMVKENAQYLSSASYLFFIPLVVAGTIAVTLYIVGQTLADASDPRTHMI